MPMGKSDDKLHLERGVALKVIADEAQKMRDRGDLPFEIQTFINGARKKLTEEAPDPDTYRKALDVAYAHKASKGEI